MDLIDRQALLKQIEIDSDGEPGYYGDTWKFIDTIKNLPSATDNNVGTEHGTNLASLGTDCISRQAAIDIIEDFPHGDVWNVESMEEMVDRIKQLQPIQPEPKRGKWILDRSGAYCCSECMEPCAGYVMMKPRDKFCKMCGSRNEVTT